MSTLKTMTFVGNRILVESIEEEKSDDGIVTPESAKPSTMKGTVVKLGNAERVEWLKDMKEGDVVLFERRTGTFLPIDNKGYLVLNEREHILAVL
jgi:co-chaperonin GroES (HSP10)